MVILSIDPGKKGGIVISDYKDGSLKDIKLFPMPLLKNKEYDLRTIKDIYKSHKDFVDFAAVEKVHSIAGSSAKSNFVFGTGFGIVLAFASFFEIPYLEVPPKTWQKVAWEGIAKVKDPKKNSDSARHRLFPNIDFTPTKRSTKPSDGLIDAALIGYYVYQKYNKV